MLIYTLLCSLGANEESNFHHEADTYFTNHVLSIVHDIEQYKPGLQEYCTNELENINQWGCKADQDIANHIDSLPSFSKMWGANSYRYTV